MWCGNSSEEKKGCGVEVVGRERNDDARWVWHWSASPSQASKLA
jgi:hypothetical protein